MRRRVRHCADPRCFTCAAERDEIRARRVTLTICFAIGVLGAWSYFADLNLVARQVIAREPIGAFSLSGVDGEGPEVDRTDARLGALDLSLEDAR